MFTFLLAVTQPHDALDAQNCKCSVLNYRFSFDWRAEWKLKLIWFSMKNLLHLSVSNWVNFICTQGLLVLLPLYHSGIVLRSLIVPSLQPFRPFCVSPFQQHFCHLFSQPPLCCAYQEKQPLQLPSNCQVSGLSVGPWKSFLPLIPAGTSQLIAFCIEHSLFSQLLRLLEL